MMTVTIAAAGLTASTILLHSLQVYLMILRENIYSLKPMKPMGGIRPPVGGGGGLTSLAYLLNVQMLEGGSVMVSETLHSGFGGNLVGCNGLIVLRM